METVLVTGAAGFIGLNMLKYLNSKDIDIYAMVLKDDLEGIMRIKKLSPHIKIVTETIEELIINYKKYPQFDIIFHFATVGIRPDFNNISLICDINIKMGCRLIDFVKLTSSNLLVNVGSCFEYGSNDGTPLTEEDNCHPESLYAISKNSAVNLMNAYSKNVDVNMITVRPFGVFGSGEGKNRLAPSIIYHGIHQIPLDLSGGEQIRDFVDVKDVVSCTYQLSKSKKIINNEIYNICSDTPVTVKEFAMEVINYFNFDISLFHFGKLPYRKNEAMCFIGDNSKLMQIIDYQFPKDHIKGINDIYNEMKVLES